MKKGLIIGMAGLGVGLAVAGGVGGYFISDSIKETPIKNDNVSEITSYTDYNLPEDFNYASFTRYDIGENFAMFSSSSVGTYLLNKKTKDFTFFSDSVVSSASKEMNGYKYFWFINDYLFEFNIKTGEYKVVTLGFKVSLSYIDFFGCSDNSVFMIVRSIDSDCYFLAYDATKETCDVYEINNSIYNSSSDCFDLGDYYYLTRTYSSSSSSTYGSYLLNKESKEIVTVSDCYLYYSSSYFVKNSKMYAVMRKSSSATLCAVDLSSGSVEVLMSSVNNSGGKFFEYEKGVVFSSIAGFNSSSYAYYYAYYISFEDDSVSEIKLNSESVKCLAHIVNGKLVFSPYCSDKYGKLALLNEETLELDVIYTATKSSSSSGVTCLFYEFNEKLYVSSDSTNFYSVTIGESGEFEFNRISIKCKPSTIHKYEIAENRYIFDDSGLAYYDFETDTYKVLLSSSSLSIKEISVDDSVVTLYVSNNIKYEFNLNTLSIKAVGYWE